MEGSGARGSRKRIRARTVAFGVISIILLLALLWLADPSEMISIISGANLAIIGLVLLLYFANLLTKALRWFFLLKWSGYKVPFTTALSFVIVGLSVNSVTPGRIAGEPVRAYMLREKKGVRFGSGLATVFTERVMDLLVLTLFAIIGLALILTFLPLSGGLSIAIFILLIIVLLGAVVYLALNPSTLDRAANWFVRTTSRLVRRPLPKWEEAVSRTVNNFSDGFRGTLKSKKATFSTFGMTVVIWLNEAFRLYLVMYALAPESAPFVGFVLIAASLATLLGSFIPGGTFNVALIAMVFNASGIDIALATTAGLLMTLTSIWILVPLGIIIVVRNLANSKSAEEKLVPVEVGNPTEIKE
jgi:uncharacterized protein (TIRG00374 family)